jgi:hypothetical protein
VVEGEAAGGLRVISFAEFIGCIGFVGPYVFPMMKAAGQ